ncbi:MAG: arginase family protein [Gammaproteobacteria bacterium]|nr:arginase family protein [Gammaproteobacteria bacterium]
MNDEAPRMKAMFGGQTQGGFFDLPVQDPSCTDTADAVLIGAPAATPYTSVGNYCAAAPAAIRQAFGWPGVLDHYDFDLGGRLLPDGASACDWGDLEYSESDFAANRAAITARVEQALAIGAVPLVLGGDDSVPIPVLQAYRDRGPLTILQFDAHIDWRDEVGGERLGLSSNMRRAAEMAWVKNIVQVGARGHGSARPSDRDAALDWGVSLLPMREYRRRGIDAVIDAIPADANLYIALDIDVMDPTVVPAVIGPAPGGFDYWQLVEILQAVAGHARIVGANLVELMPAADVGGRGALAAARIVATLLGLILRQQTR